MDRSGQAGAWVRTLGEALGFRLVARCAEGRVKERSVNVKRSQPGISRIHVRYADVGLPRPGRYSSESFHIDRAVANIHELKGGARGEAEQGEIRFQHRAVPVYRLKGTGSTWTTDRARVMEPMRITFLR